MGRRTFIADPRGMPSGRVCSCSLAKSCPILWDPMECRCQSSLSFTISQKMLKLMFIELMMPSTHLILCHPHLLLLSIFPSISIFSKESALCIRWPIGASNSASVFPMSIYCWFSVEWLIWCPYQPQNSQVSSPAPQFENINFGGLSLLYGPTLMCLHDYCLKP